MVSWEYPPVVVGGLGRHVHALATELAAAGHEVVVLSRQPAGSDATTHPTTDEGVNGVRVLRVAEDPLHLGVDRDLVAWTLALGRWRANAARVRDVRERYAPGGAPVLLYFGRLEYEKGVQDLVAALPRIRRAHPGTRLLVTGTGTAHDQLLAAVDAHRVRRSVTFTGHLPDADLAALLRAVDAVVLPS